LKELKSHSPALNQMTSVTVMNAEKKYPKKDFLLFHWPERASIASQILNAADSHKMRFPVQTTPARF